MEFTVITGGGRGLGTAIALRLESSGHNLFLGYRRDGASAQQVAVAVREIGPACHVL